ncbi:hypothetical protein, partial [Escherichia coli]|uniref:hypothetical protein n=1 Tax=Escherichia coli TaxID=562 RepID=UPI000BC660C5
HRWSAERAADQKDTTTQRTQYNANGQPLQAGPRSYRWDALGRLEQVSEQGASLARYRYNHRWSAERAADQKDTTTQRTQYNANGQPLQAGPR